MIIAIGKHVFNVTVHISMGSLKRDSGNKLLPTIVGEHRKHSLFQVGGYIYHSCITWSKVLHVLEIHWAH